MLMKHTKRKLSRYIIRIFNEGFNCNRTDFNIVSMCHKNGCKKVLKATNAMC